MWWSRGMGSGSNRGEIPVRLLDVGHPEQRHHFWVRLIKCGHIYRIMSFSPSAKKFQQVFTLSVMCNVSKTLWLQMRACVRAAGSVLSTVDAGKRNFKWPLFVVNLLHRYQRLLTCMKSCIFFSHWCADRSFMCHNEGPSIMRTWMWKYLECPSFSCSGWKKLLGRSEIELHYAQVC